MRWALRICLCPSIAACQGKGADDSDTDTLAHMSSRILSPGQLAYSVPFSRSSSMRASW
jgi:hypothetical protein